eukprot:9248257-Heterocapsa_arctica.AAC.1
MGQQVKVVDGIDAGLSSGAAGAITSNSVVCLAEQNSRFCPILPASAGCDLDSDLNDRLGQPGGP